MQQKIEILAASQSNKPKITTLLRLENLPFEDLPAQLDNFFIAVVGETVVGAVGIELYGRFGLLRSLVVRADYRGRAIAQKLVKAVEDKAAELQLKSIYLLTETAKGYFDRKGFTPISRDDVPDAVKQSSEFSHVCPVTAVVMQKRFS